MFTVKLHHAIAPNIGFTPMSTCVCGGTDNAGREAVVEYTSEKDLIVARVFEYGLGIRETKCARYRGR